MSMEAIITGLLALNGTLVAALIWVVKKVIGTLSTDIRDNTKATAELRDYQISHARTQRETTDALRELVDMVKARG